VKIFISSDMEGTAGVVDWDQCVSTGAQYSYYTDLLTGEVNAAIEGAREAGASEFLVNDSHSKMMNLRPGALAGRARYLSGRYKPMYMMQGLDASFDAAFFVSYHGGISAATAILSHTYNPGCVYEVRVDGHAVGESALNALVAAHHGVPIALVTGDAATGQESEWFAPEAERVVVKESITRYAATNLHPEVARRLIRAGAERAVQRVGEMQPPRFGRPGRVEIDFLTADMAEMATWVHGVERRGARTVAFAGDDTLALYQRFVTIIALTRGLSE
jgi:D-amino peptidase